MRKPCKHNHPRGAVTCLQVSHWKESFGNPACETFYRHKHDRVACCHQHMRLKINSKIKCSCVKGQHLQCRSWTHSECKLIANVCDGNDTATAGQAAHENKLIIKEMAQKIKVIFDKSKCTDSYGATALIRLCRRRPWQWRQWCRRWLMKRHISICKRRRTRKCRRKQNKKVNICHKKPGFIWNLIWKVKYIPVLD